MTTRKLLSSISLNHDVMTKMGNWLFWSAIFIATLATGTSAHAAVQCDDTNTITADVVVLDNPTVFNRLGAQNPNWITYALRRDVVYVDWGNPRRPDPNCLGIPKSGDLQCEDKNNPGTFIDAFIGDSDHLKPITKVTNQNKIKGGNVELRPDKRPRPLVIRGIAGSCLTVKFENLLSDVANPHNAGQGQNTPGVGEPKRANPDCAVPPVHGDLLCEDVNNPGNQIAAFIGPAFPGLENNDQVAGRCAGFHASGTELVGTMADDGSMVGNNPGGVDEFAGTKDCGYPQSGLVAPGQSITYNLYTPHEGAFIINSYGATLGSEANAGNLGIGMFGALNVQPCGDIDSATGICKATMGARIYRSQVTEEELRLATTGHVPSDCPAAGPDMVMYTGDDIAPGAGEIVGLTCDPGGQPIIDYEKTYPKDCDGDVDDANKTDGIDGVWCQEGKDGLPIINMLTADRELVHSDINAIIAGPLDTGMFPKTTYPLESVDKVNPQLPNRLEPFREFTSQFHDEQTNSQVFPNWYNHPVMRHVVHGVKDQFMINYGSGGIGSEIIANRLRTGPMHDCTDCAYEEFFLASQTVGDPAMLVNFPANTGIEACNPENIAADQNTPGGNSCWRIPAQDTDNDGVPDTGLANGPIEGNYALYQEDPSNLHHTYPGDFVKYRNTHAGAFEQHIFHFHNHQWLFNPNDDNANYLDAQEIMPGSGHTYEIVNGGAGNRNKTTGDAIFHCHFYPHFAQGMWYHQRIHDVFETGTVLAVSEADDPQKPIGGYHKNRWDLRSGKPAANSRALPDGELPDGSPIPAVVPLPGKPMPQIPAEVKVVAIDRGGNSLLGGRTLPDGIDDSSQSVVTRASVWGADGDPHTADDVSPGYPFWLAGNECGSIDDGMGNIVEDPDCTMGIVGQRMPTPPLDMLTEEGAGDATINPNSDKISWGNLGGGWDGGLPRHALRGYTSAGSSADTQNRLDFRKVVHMVKPVFFPELGTDLEQVSMAYQAERFRKSVANDLVGSGTTNTDGFVLNGSPPVPGGPFNDPCVDDNGESLLGQDGYWFDGTGGKSIAGKSPWTADDPRTYKIANLQIDAVFNKLGHHYSQERIIILWEDITPTVKKQRPPEPLVMRFNTFDCGKILHANLVPSEFEVDDFQVRTPTDIIGQHIHLPKWDLTTNDGAANGWNYEDGTLSPMMVEERIHAINNFNQYVAACQADPNQCVIPAGFIDSHDVPWHNLGPIDLTGLVPVATLTAAEGADPGATRQPDPFKLKALDHPDPAINDPNNPQQQFGMYHGARTTIQRILVDPVVNVSGIDRGLGLTFSHDHYGPSTFQQIGLYSTILAEPAGSAWYHNESGDKLNDYVARTDGGPTSWQAVIETGGEAGYTDNVGGQAVPDHREFYFEMSDFQHAYNLGTLVGADGDGVPDKCKVNGCLDPAGEIDINQPNPFNATVAFAPSIQDTWQEAVNPTLKTEAQTFPDVVTAKGGCPGPLGNFDPNVPRPCAEAINIGHSSTWVINYRNEPVGYRVFDPSKKGPDGQNGSQADGPAGDLALAFMSRNDRAVPQMNTRFGDTPYPTGNSMPDPYCDGNDGDMISCDRGVGDPFTPIMRTYEGDEVKVKIQVGATEEQHQTTIHGIKWLSNGSGFGRSPNSGWRNFQSHGISEQFSLQAPLNPALQQAGQTVDYLYATDATRPGIWLGTWGILRTYGKQREDLHVLPDSVASGHSIGKNIEFTNSKDFNGVCPKNAPVESFDITAVLANDVLPNNLGVTIPDNVNPVDNVGGPLNPDGGTLVYNRRGTEVRQDLGNVMTGGFGPLNDPTAMMYVLTDDLMSAAEKQAIDEGLPCFNTKGKNKGKFNPTLSGCSVNISGCETSGGSYDPKLATCPIVLRENVPVEPLVLRANAGDCIDVTLRNRLVGRQAVVKNTDSKVYYGDGRAVFAPLYPSDKYYDENGGQVAANNIEFFGPPDLAGWQDMMWGVTRHIQGVGAHAEMHFFNNNLVRPGAYAGIHPQLVEYDASRDDGVAVGRNQPQVAPPGGTANARYYAGHIEYEPVAGRNNRRSFEIKAIPVEFGGTNLLSADRIKQPQKGLFGALVIEPQGADVIEDTLVPDGQGSGNMVRPTRAQVTVNAGTAGDAGNNGTYRETVAVAHKIANLRWKDGSAIKNVNQEELGVEGAEDSGHAGFNYGMEPSWFRFKLPPNVPFGNAGTPNSYGSIPNVQALFANSLVAGEPNAIPEVWVDHDDNPSTPKIQISEAGDPQTPVFRTTVDRYNVNPVLDTRMHVVTGASADRDSTYILHGHVWQRDPYVCTGTPGSETDASVSLVGRCDPWAVAPSNALGINPQAKYMGGEEGMGHVYGHWPILFDAGGTFGVTGDYLFRDYAPNGSRNGMFGILRVEE